jgi:hypothetical protein
MYWHQPYTYTINVRNIMLLNTLDISTRHTRVECPQISPMLFMEMRIQAVVLVYCHHITYTELIQRHFYTTITRHISLVVSISACVPGILGVIFGSKADCPDCVHGFPRWLQPRGVMVHENMTRPLPSSHFPAPIQSHPFNWHYALCITYVNVHEPVVRGPFHIHNWTHALP